MTKREKKLLVSRLLLCHKNLDHAFESLGSSVGLNPDSPLFSAAWGAFDGYTRVVSDLIGDRGSWLSWHIYENDCGKNGMKVVTSSEEFQIKTLDDLLRVIDLDCSAGK